MANYPIKMLKDEQGTPFVPLVSTQAVRNPDGQTVEDILAAKLSPENIKAGENIIVTQSGSDVTITADVPDTTVLIDNLTTTAAGQGALDARQGNVLLNAIPDVEDSLNSQSTDDALSANQGYILNNRVVPLEEDLEGIKDSLKTLNGNNELDIEDAVEASAVGYTVDGATQQDSYNGKNLLKIPTSVSRTFNGITYTVNEDGSVTVKGTVTQAGGFYVDLDTSIELDGIYTFSLKCVGTTNASGNQQWLLRQSDNTTVYSPTIISNDTRYNSGEKHTTISKLQIFTADNATIDMTIYPQLEKGAGHTDWEPYVGGTVSPNPDYPQDVETIPSIINLFDNKAIPISYVNATSKVINTGVRIISTSAGVSGSSYCARYIIFDMTNHLGETYTLSSTVTTNSTNHGRYLILACDSNGENRNVIANKDNLSNGYQKLSFTLPTSISGSSKYLMIVLNSNFNDASSVSGDYVDYTNIMLEKYSTPHEYIPYGHYARVKITGKNLYGGFTFTKTAVGITFTYNEDGTITANGTATGTALSMTSGDASTNNFLKTLPAGEYTISTGLPNVFINVVNSSGTVIANTTANNLTRTFTINENTDIFMRIQINNGTTVSNQKVYVMLERNSTASTYEPYKEREALIDLSKENLFTNDEERYWNSNYGSISKISNGLRITQSSSGTYRFAGYIFESTPMLGKTFTISCDYKLSNTNNIPLVNVYWFNKSTNNITTQIKALSANGGTFSVPSTATNDNIAILFYSNVNGSSSAANDYTDYTDIKLFEGESKTPYYELCKIEDYKDTLSIDSNGNCIINKNIYKIDMNSGTLTNYGYVSGNSDANYSQFNIVLNTSKKPSNANSGSIFKSKYFSYYSSAHNPNKTQSGVRIWDTYPDIVISFPTPLLTTGQESASFINWANNNDLSIYGLLKTPETIILPNTQIPLYEGINHIYLIDDLETQTEIKYYSQNAFSDIYYTKQETDDHIKDLIPEGGQSGQVLMQDVNGELTWGDAADPNAIVGDGSIKKIVELTYEEYKALDSIDPDTEYHILDAASSLDNLQATLDSLQEQIDILKIRKSNPILKRCLVTEIAWGEVNKWAQMPFDSAISQDSEFNSWSYNNGIFTVGLNVSRVRVKSTVAVNHSSWVMYGLFVNDNQICKTICGSANTPLWYTLYLDKVIDVNPGDEISLRVYKDSSGSATLAPLITTGFKEGSCVQVEIEILE